MSNDEKILGNRRRNLIIEWLQKSSKPITGQQLAERTNVSRQAIVQDISLLKAKEYPIIATNRGYLYLNEGRDEGLIRRKIVCRHTPEETEAELNLIVDCGVTVKDVQIEHGFYGGLTGSLMVSSRFDAAEFLEQLSKSDSLLLSELTDGVHLHTLEADSEEKLDAAIFALKKHGYLVEEDD